LGGGPGEGCAQACGSQAERECQRLRFHPTGLDQIAVGGKPWRAGKLLLAGVLERGLPIVVPGPTRRS
jgi:hypothetical protein